MDVLPDQGITGCDEGLFEELPFDKFVPAPDGTPMVEDMLGHADTPNSERLSMHPLGRLSTPEEQAAAAVFLCGQGASFVTGVSLSVDGGRAIR